MATLDLNGTTVQTDDEGFLIHGAQWTPDLAELLARGAGIAALTDKHWNIIALCREEAARRGAPPGHGRILKLSGVSADELKRLFPGDPENTIALIAGLPRPRALRNGGAEPQEARS